jgi:hypothetical protein
MRLVKLVVAGVVLGAAGGYAAALLRPRTVHRSRAADGPGEGLLDPAPLPERVDGATPPYLMTVPDTAEVHR